MSFKCSIFGHDYGNSEVEREREEDGSEVVITIRETETCARCGDTRVVSENKEVTTLETAADIVADDLEDEETAPDDAGHDTGTPGEPQQTADPPGQPAPETESAPTGGASSTDHSADAIPDAESTTSVDAPTEDDGVILDEDETADADDDRAPGEWPEEPDEEDGSDWEPPTDIDPQPDTERPSVESTGNAVTVPDGEFYCPQCGFTTPVESSSLREGDFCPECHQGALEHETE